jgi:hypothetical protein
LWLIGENGVWPRKGPAHSVYTTACSAVVDAGFGVGQAGAPTGFAGRLSAVVFLETRQDKSSFLKKRSKDFYGLARRQHPAMAGIFGAAEMPKSFGSFLQKRTRLPFKLLNWLIKDIVR